MVYSKVIRFISCETITSKHIFMVYSVIAYRLDWLRWDLSPIYFLCN